MNLTPEEIVQFCEMLKVSMLTASENGQEVNVSSETYTRDMNRDDPWFDPEDETPRKVMIGRGFTVQIGKKEETPADNKKSPSGV